jgi:hypothetical protein
MREFPYLSDGKASQPLHDRSSTNDHAEPWISVAFTKAQLAYHASTLCGFETEEIEKLKASHPTALPQDIPSLSSPEVSTNNDALKRRDRSNRPSRTNYTQYRTFLYRLYVYDTAMVKKKKHATAYAVARDIVHCCWRTDIERWLHGPEVQQQFPEVSHTEAPRPVLVRPGNIGKSQRRRKQRAGINLNRHQKSYEHLMSELRENFEASDPHTRASSTSENDGDVRLQNSLWTSLAKEEFQDGDESPGGIEDEYSRDHPVHVEPLKYTVKSEPHIASTSSRSEGSLYSIAERRFETNSQSQDRDSVAVVAVMPEQTATSNSKGDSIEGLAKATSGLRRSNSRNHQKCEDESGVAVSSGAVKNKEDSDRRSPKKESGSLSRSIDSGSTSWPRPYHESAGSGFIEDRNDHLPAPPALDASTHAANTETRKRKDPPAILGQSVVGKDTPVIAESSRKYSKNRQTIFPGLNREVKADINEAAKLLERKRPARRTGKSS